MMHPVVLLILGSSTRMSRQQVSADWPESARLSMV
jgi:hypothetical protein